MTSVASSSSDSARGFGAGRRRADLPARIAVHRRFLANLAQHADLLPGADSLAFVDVDPSHVRVFGRGKVGEDEGVDLRASGDS